ncbi:MAG TPA: alternative ribosome rescue aminoacyl-tRNA hydrolase ArfB [Thermoanaerobaculia bacterium]|nr:alternative ribosome rescue aminoacyl-tRNA hydrolase ArfB [Thermoanaerobaculia bacterium]
MVAIREGVEIPDDEITVATARSGGPGGQNVNKVETKVMVRFRPADSRVLDEADKARIAERLAPRLTRGGVLQVSSQRHRSQAANKQAALERLGELLRDALAEEAERVPTRVPRGQKKRRLQGKRRRSEIKSGRGPVQSWD